MCWQRGCLGRDYFGRSAGLHGPECRDYTGQGGIRGGGGAECDAGRVSHVSRCAFGRAYWILDCAHWRCSSPCCPLARNGVEFSVEHVLGFVSSRVVRDTITRASGRRGGWTCEVESSLGGGLLISVAVSGRQ
jgi:hypothetical protein